MDAVGQELAELSVLVTDDSHYTREILKTVLRGFGINKVKEADSGLRAFELLDEADVDLIICDIEMPVLNGIDFVRMLRSRTRPPTHGNLRAPDPNTPVIMLTSHAKKSLVDGAREAGANAFIVKPVVPKVLLDRIEKIVSRREPDK
jgi:CheY-like chemotaxis protein